ncbi:MAG: type II CRISPR RNA-guided endonuclease Cas9 [Deltaproteobacteria bacterium]|nr:type II CRISPR RNA-guided endonuclease Cas9 [Deltaproteobacteria bacterium]
MKTRLGLDLGEKSIGWAILNESDDGFAGVLDCGVRIFPAGAKIDERDGSAITPSADRRAHRGARRTKERRRRRKNSLKRALTSYGLAPHDPTEWEAVLLADPYELRNRALAEALEPFEIGRVLYHLCQRRGFKSNRKSEGEAKKEEGVVKKEIGELSAHMEAAGTPTVGSYFHRLRRDSKGVDRRVRNHRTSRKMYEDEFSTLWNKQAVYHPNLMTDDARGKIHHAIFHQRPFELTEERRLTLPPAANAHRAPQVATCPLIKDEPRCPKGRSIAQRFRILKEVNNLRANRPDGTEVELSKEDRLALVEQLSSQKQMTFSKMRKLLKLPDDVRFNLEEGKRKYLDGNTVEYALANAFGKKEWSQLERHEKDRFVMLLDIADEGEFRAQAKALGLSDEAIDELSDLATPSGYLAYSEAVIGVLIPYLEEGMNEYDAIQAAREAKELPEDEQPEQYDFLPQIPDVTNPIVKRALREMRLVVNAVIRAYGKPDKIVVELAREMKQNRQGRQNTINRIRDNEKLNKQADAFFEAAGRSFVSNTDRQIYRLWQEQGEVCPYSGRKISMRNILSAENDLDVDHILPYSRTFDNTMMNKVLCFADSNRDKKDRTPYEWRHGSKDYDEMLTRIANMSLMPDRKKSRFSMAELKDDEFVERQLRDTAFVTREAVKYLELLYPRELRTGQKAVETRPGGVTAELRKEWGLNHLIGGPWGKKNRDNHKHHALDAVVVACSTRAQLQQLTRLYQQRESIGQSNTASFAPPWPSFVEEVDHLLNKREQTWKINGREITTRGLLVSTRVERKIRGKFHDESIYGPSKEYRNQLQTPQHKSAHLGPKGEFRIRIEVEKLNAQKLVDENKPYICDQAVRQAILDYCKARGVDPSNGGKFPPTKNFFGELTMPRRHSDGLPNPIRNVRIWKHIGEPFLIPDADGIFARAVNLKNNHHIEFVEITNDQGKKENRAVVVSMLEAANRVRRHKVEMVRRDHGEGSRFLMSLASNESALIAKAEQFELCRVQEISGKSKLVKNMDVVFRRHDDARPAKNAKKDPFLRLRSFGSWDTMPIIKVTVDPLGRLHAAND